MSEDINNKKNGFKKMAFMKMSIFLWSITSILSAMAQQIPLEVFAKHPKFKDMIISPTGEYIAFTYDEGLEGKMAIMERKSNKVLSSYGFGANRVIGDLNWFNDTRLGMMITTEVGWLDGVDPDPSWVATNVDGTKRTELWDFQRSNMRLVSILKKEKDQVLVAKSHWADKGGAKLFKLNIYNGKLDYLAISPPSAAHTVPGIVGYGVDLNDDVRFAYEYDQGDDEINDQDDTGYLHFKDKEGIWRKIILQTDRKVPDVNVLGFSNDNQRAYFASNHDQDKSDSTGLFEFDFKTETIRKIFRHEDADILGRVTGNNGQTIGVVLEPGYPEVFYLENVDNAADISKLKSLFASFSGQYVSVTSRSDNKDMLIAVRSDRNPGEFYLYHNSKKTLSYLASTKVEVDSEKMARVEPFTMQARDGLKMYGFLTIPNGVKEENLPLVIYPHGGPYGVADRWRWDRRAQMLASRGYLVLQLNYRGSGNYGKDFLEAGYTEWGAKMQDDLTDATLWAINLGLANPDRICIHGVSYGGYASLNAVVKEPDLYKCSIPDAGVYEMAVQWDKADSFKGSKGSERKQLYMERSIGGYDKVKERSPLYHLDKLKADLFLVHGGADVRVPIINAELVEDKLKELGKSYIKMYKEKEGHGFTQEANRVELYEAILLFLEKNIGEGSAGN